MTAWTGPEQKQGDGPATGDSGASAFTERPRLQEQGLRLEVQLAMEWAHLGGD